MCEDDSSIDPLGFINNDGFSSEKDLCNLCIYISILLDIRYSFSLEFYAILFSSILQLNGEKKVMNSKMFNLCTLMD